MKIAEEWFKEACNLPNGQKHVPYLSQELIKQVQLDAYKAGEIAGITEAAEIAEQTSIVVANEITTKSNIIKRILSARDKKETI